MKHFITLILSIIFCNTIFNFGYAEKPNVLFFNPTEEDENNSIDIGLDWSSNSTAYGHINSDTKQATISPNISYSAPFGLILSGIFSRISNSDSTGTLPAYEYGFSAGYDFSLLNDKLTISPSYSHFFHSDNSEALISIINNQYSLGFLAHGKNLRGSLNISYINGAYTDFPVNFGLSAPIRFKKKFTDDDRFSISPGFKVYFGKQTFNEFLLLSNIQNFYDKNRKKHPNYDPTISELQKSNIYKKIQKLEKDIFNSEPLDQNEKLSDFIQAANLNMPQNYGLTALGISVPFTYILNDLFINITPSGLIPFTLTQSKNKKTGANKSSLKPDGIVFYVSAGITYTFDW